MNTKDYSNTIELQIKSLPSLAEIQADRCFSEETLLQIMPIEKYENIKKIIITGCGDSYSAAGSMARAIKSLSNIDLCLAPDPMEFTRFYTKETILGNYLPEEVLVISVSASGGADRIAEILGKANAIGVESMLITNNLESRGAKIATYVFNLNTPPLSDSPGLRSYFASMVALVALGAFIGVANKTLTTKYFSEVKNSLVSYVKSFEPRLAEIDSQMIELANTWNYCRKFEIVGDDYDLFSAQFAAQTFIECAGIQSTNTDSEDWCHINFFLRDTSNIITIFKTSKNSPSFDRIVESVRVAISIGRPVLVITDADPSDFDGNAVICTLPSPPTNLNYLTPLMNYVPDTLLAAYFAVVNDSLFFGGRFDYRKKIFLSDVSDGITIPLGSSEIQIIV